MQKWSTIGVLLLLARIVFMHANACITSCMPILTKLDAGIEESGNTLVNKQFFDTLTIKPRVDSDAICRQAVRKEINLRYFPNGMVGYYILVN